MKNSWREMIEEALVDHEETWNDILSITLTEKELDRKFDSSYGTVYGAPFTAWTMKRVYFPAVYDGAEWVESVARFPDGKPTDHIGGG